LVRVEGGRKGEPCGELGGAAAMAGGKARSGTEERKLGLRGTRVESQNGFGSETDEDDLNGGGMDRRATRVGPDVESGDGAAEEEDRSNRCLSPV